MIVARCFPFYSVPWWQMKDLAFRGNYTVQKTMRCSTKEADSGDSQDRQSRDKVQRVLLSSILFNFETFVAIIYIGRLGKTIEGSVLCQVLSAGVTVPPPQSSLWDLPLSVSHP